MTCRLLILDDDPMVAATLAMIAESVGASTCVTTDAERFFLLLDEFLPSHVYVDLNMPRKDGLQVLAELAQLKSRVRVIVGSGVGARVLEAAARSAREQGLDVAGVLPKPFPLADLRSLLRIEVKQHASRAGGDAEGSAWRPDPKDVAQAIAQRQLHVLYQPKVRCHDRQLSGVEALVRWQHPEHGLISPEQFVPVAEAADLIDDLTLLVLDEALAWFAPWSARAALADPPVLAINLSARSLHKPNVVESILARCEAWSIMPGRLTFELTETAAMEDPVAALALLTRLRVHGFQLSLDDFGTGYSSMLQLVRLPFSEIKIDRSFVMTAPHSQESRTVIRSITELGHSLGLEVTAEGVEHGESLEYLQQVGCDHAQGYWIARPLTPRQLEAWSEVL